MFIAAELPRKAILRVQAESLCDCFSCCHFSKTDARNVQSRLQDRPVRAYPNRTSGQRRAAVSCRLAWTPPAESFFSAQGRTAPLRCGVRQFGLRPLMGRIGGVDSVHTFGFGLGRTSVGSGRIPYVSGGVQCLQGLESGSSHTSGTWFPCSGACGPLSVHKVFT
jgi:hypothetical protein